MTGVRAWVEAGEYLHVLVLETPRDEKAYGRLAATVINVVAATLHGTAVLALARTKPGLPTALTVVPPETLGEVLEAGAQRGGAATFAGPPMQGTT